MSLPSEVDKSNPAWCHLHPAVLLFNAGRILRRLLVPLIIGGVAVSRREGGMGTFIVVSAVISTFGFISGYLSFRYRLTVAGIEIREGVFTRRHRNITLTRISHVNTHQNALARLIGVVRLDVETEDGGAGEISFSALSLTAAEQIRQHIGNVGPAREDERIIYTATLRDRVFAGATTLQVGGVVAFVLLAWRYVRRARGEENADPGASQALLGEVITFFNELLVAISASPTLIAISIVVTLLAIWGFSIVLAIVRWYGFRIIEQGDELHLQNGALSRSRTSIKRGRIQAVEVRASLLRNLLGFVQIALVAAGSGRRDRARSRIFIPITSTDSARGYLNVLWPQTGDNLQWQPIHPYHRTQYITRGLLRLLVFTLITAGLVTLNPGTIIAITTIFVVLALVTWRTATPSFSQTGFALTDEYLHVRQGAVSPRRWIVAISRIQAVILVQSLFQRRHGVMDVVIDVNGLANNQRIEIPNLPRAQAEKMQRQLTPRGNVMTSSGESQSAVNR
ncbi:MAG: PH domain-containing protein [Gammaproteobacteria bacterium]|nr:PH domain-containing protein [Gammaproteobacteria bacterium]